MKKTLLFILGSLFLISFVFAASVGISDMTRGRVVWIPPIQTNISTTFVDTIDTSAFVNCSTSEVFLGNGSCSDSDLFFDVGEVFVGYDANVCFYNETILNETIDLRATTQNYSHLSNFTDDIFAGQNHTLNVFTMWNSIWSADTNASTECLEGEALFGDGSCQEVYNTSSVDNIASAIAFDFFFTNHSSDISNHYNFSEIDLGHPETSLTTSSLAVGSHNIFNFTTEIGQPEFTELREGSYDARLHLFKTGTRDVKITPKLYNMSADGLSKTLVLTFSTSIELTTIDAVYDLHGFLTSEVIIPLDNRLHMEFIAEVSGGGSNPTVTLDMEGTTDTHMSIETSSDSFQHIFLRQDSDNVTAYDVVAVEWDGNKTALLGCVDNESYLRTDNSSYLLLDGSNTPTSNYLWTIDFTTTGEIKGALINSTGNIISGGNEFKFGREDSSLDRIIYFLSNLNDGTLTWDSSANTFNFGGGKLTTTNNVGFGVAPSTNAWDVFIMEVARANNYAGMYLKNTESDGLSRFNLGMTLAETTLGVLYQYDNEDGRALFLNRKATAGTFELLTTGGSLKLENNGSVVLADVYDDDIGTQRDLLISPNGVLGYDSSSILYKENVEDMDNKMSEKIYDLRPVTYDKIDGKKNQIGLIAEEVYELYPEFISYKREEILGEICLSPDDCYEDVVGYKLAINKTTGEYIPETISYKMLVTPMIKEIQNLNEENIIFNQTIQNLKQENNLLKSCISTSKDFIEMQECVK